MSHSPQPSSQSSTQPGPRVAPTGGWRDRWFTLNDRTLTFDSALALVITVISAGPYLNVSHGVFLGSTILGGCLAIRRTWPRIAILLGTLACLFMLVTFDRFFVGIVIVPILIYSVARWSDRTTARLGLAAGLVGSVLGPLRWFATTASGLTEWALIGMTGLACAAIVAGTYLVGRRRQESVQQGAYRVAAQQEQARLSLAEQQQRARAASIDERNQIARELHDIVAHSLSVIVVQAEGGKAIAVKRPERAPEVLETIAETSREALAEMRQMVGLLRRGDLSDAGGQPGDGQPGDRRTGAETYRPAPGLGDLAELVRKTTDRARLVTDGSAPMVSQGVGLTCYRIVQESLTNVLKHAGPKAHATVGVHYATDRIEISIADDGRGGGGPADGMGHGLQGMRERVGLHGGSLVAGPTPDGFTVRAILPLNESRLDRAPAYQS